MPFKVRTCENHIFGRLNHVTHLTHDVLEHDGLIVELLHAPLLFGLEIDHLLGAYQPVRIQVDHFEPLVDAPGVAFVLLGQHETHEVILRHSALLVFEFFGDLVKYPIYCFSRQRMPVLLSKIFFRNQEVMICVQFPKSTL